MKPFSINVPDSELIAFVDEWVALLEKEDYGAAFAFTAHVPAMRWTPELMREVIKGYGDADPRQRVTSTGKPTHLVQRKDVHRCEPTARGYAGYIWYDLNVDGQLSDLTAVFDLMMSDGGVIVCLEDIHVM